MMKINEGNFDSDKIKKIKNEIFKKVEKSINEKNITSKEIESDVKILLKPNNVFDLTFFLDDIIGLDKNFQADHKKYYLNEYILCCKFLSDSRKITNENGRKEFLMELLGTLYLFDLTVISPNINEIKDIELRNNVSVNDAIFKNYINDVLFDKLIKLNTMLKKIFTYEDIIYEFRDELLDAMKLNICPYCNESLIYRISCSESEDEDFSILDLDHFYKKSTFPLFSLSIGNFVPSCIPCNRNLKAQSVQTISNPRIEGFNKLAYFKASIPSDYLLSNFDYEKIKIDILKNSDQFSEDNTKVINSIKVFKIKTRYNHIDIKETAGDLLKTAKELNDKSYLDYITSVVNKTNKNHTYEDLKTFAFNINYDDEQAIDHRLGKLKKDLIRQLTNL